MTDCSESTGQFHRPITGFLHMVTQMLLLAITTFIKYILHISLTFQDHFNCSLYYLYYLKVIKSFVPRNTSLACMNRQRNALQSDRHTIQHLDEQADRGTECGSDPYVSRLTRKYRYRSIQSDLDNYYGISVQGKSFQYF